MYKVATKTAGTRSEKEREGGGTTGQNKCRRKHSKYIRVPDSETNTHIYCRRKTTDKIIEHHVQWLLSRVTPQGGEGGRLNNTTKLLLGRQKYVSKSRHHITAGAWESSIHARSSKGGGHNNVAAHTWVVLVLPLSPLFFQGIVVGTVGKRGGGKVG